MIKPSAHIINDAVTEAIRIFSLSNGLLPFSILLPDIVKLIPPTRRLIENTHAGPPLSRLLCFYKWNDISNTDVEDYIVCSHEYNLIPEADKQQYLEGKLAGLVSEVQKTDWACHLIDLHVGIALGILRSVRIPFTLFDDKALLSRMTELKRNNLSLQYLLVW